MDHKNTIGLTAISGLLRRRIFTATLRLTPRNTPHISAAPTAVWGFQTSRVSAARALFGSDWNLGTRRARPSGRALFASYERERDTPAAADQARRARGFVVARFVVRRKSDPEQ